LRREPRVVPLLLACDDPGMRPESDSLL